MYNQCEMENYQQHETSLPYEGQQHVKKTNDQEGMCHKLIHLFKRNSLSEPFSFE